MYYGILTLTIITNIKTMKITKTKILKTVLINRESLFPYLNKKNVIKDTLG